MARRLLKNRVVDVILLEEDKHLGEKYEVVKVKPIYVRNVLLPRGKVVLATPDMLHMYKAKMEKAKEELKKKVVGLDELFVKMGQQGGVTVVRKVNEKDVLYDKIDAHDIAVLIQEEYKIAVDMHCIKLKKKIVAAGEYTIVYKYKEMEKNFMLVVKGEKDKHAEKAAEKIAEEVAKENTEETKEHEKKEVKEEKKVTKKSVKK